MKSRFPTWTWWLAASAVIISLSPALSRWAIYDRNAMLNGELWRLVTAPLVHFTPSHLAYDTFALILAGALIQWRGYRGIGWVCGLTALASGLVVLLLEPQLAFYGGLSGIATAAVVFLALQGSGEKGTWAWVCSAVLLGAVVKILFEVSSGVFVFLPVDPESFSRQVRHAVVHVINLSS
jgi:rhomboid family GlyGly-CTERM serine protease